jgi:hypothetical protein
MDKRAYITRRARQLGLDPHAVLAVASVEGGFRGAVGDQGTSFGPFQLHWGGAMPREFSGNTRRSQAWANSPAGIDYALNQIAAHARGLTGKDAIHAIVTKFERPAAPGAEIQKALGRYGGNLGAVGASPGSVPAMTGFPPVVPPSSAAPSLPDVLGSSFLDIAMGVRKPTETLPDVVEAVTAPPSLPTTLKADLRGHPTEVAARMPDPGGGWGGSQRPAMDLARLSGLTITSTKRDRKATASGGVSDHWVGSKDAFATDLGGSVSDMDRAAVVLARRLGIPYRKGQPLVATVTRGGLRYQLLYRTQVGGNHFDHIHVGVRRTG